MDKRYQVFISSTYKDLLEERQEVIQALLELDCIPAGMELFPAADDDQWTLIKKVIDDCDYYIIIVGGRYGSLSPSGISYTEMEYDYAISQGKPVIGFIHKNPGAISASKTEDSTEGKIKLDAFRKKVEQKMCKYWSSPSELGSVVSRSLIKLIKNNPAIGWVRANLGTDETSAQEILKLKKRIEELEIESNHIRTEAPKGTEDFAQGDDLFKIRYTYYTFEYDEWSGPFNETCIISWAKIFSIVSPLLMSQASERSIQSSLTDFLSNHVSGYLEELHTGISDRFSVEIFDVQTIIIQLRALGLITKGSLSGNSSNEDTYWTLTAYGDSVMTKLRAIPKLDSVIPF